jgi:hypothetical protein
VDKELGGNAENKLSTVTYGTFLGLAGAGLYRPTVPNFLPAFWGTKRENKIYLGPE